MANDRFGMSGHNFDAFVGSQRTYQDHDFTAKIVEKYWRARQKFLAKIEKKEDTCIILSDSKLDAKLEIYRSVDKTCARLTSILEDYQNCLYIYSNEENALGILMKESSKYDKSKAGKILAITGKSLTQASHQRIKLYMPLLRIYQEMETFHSRAVEDTAETVDKLENKRSQYRASLLWMKDISARLDPDIYKQLDRFRRVQNQVRNDKKTFDKIQMDVVQKIDLLMASRCNLMNQILASYQTTLLETFEKNRNSLKSIEELIKKEDIYEYEFKTLKQLNPIQLDDDQPKPKAPIVTEELISMDDVNNNAPNNHTERRQDDILIDVFSNVDLDGCDSKLIETPEESEDIIEQLESLFGKPCSDPQVAQGLKKVNTEEKVIKSVNPSMKMDLLNMDNEEDQIANLLGESFKSPASTSQRELPGKMEELDLMGSCVEADLMGNNEKPSNSNIDLLTCDLDDIDNSSYFESLKRWKL